MSANAGDIEKEGKIGSGVLGSEASDKEVKKVQETLQRLDIKSGKDAEKALKNILSGALKKGVMPKTALKLDDETMEAIYTQGYNLYGQGKFKEASYVFRLLMLLDFTTPKYVLGLAACSHRKKDYHNAANLYLLCAALDPTNPLPHFHAADCYLNLKMPTVALFSLKMAIDTAKDQKQYSLVKERAELMREALDKQLEESAKSGKAEKKENEVTSSDK